MPATPTVLLVNQYFWPDRAATAQLLGDLAEDAARAGLEVTVLCGRGSYARADEGPLAARERWRGTNIRRVWCTNLGRGSAVRRVVDYATFFVSALCAVPFGRRHDVVVCLSTPPLIAVLGVLARFKGSRFIYKVEDLYPDVAVALGALRERALTTRLLHAVSRAVLRRAETCVALDEAMAQQLERRGARRVQVIENWADGEAIRALPEAGREFRRAEGLGDDMLVLYSGNLGRAHRFDAVVEAMERLDDAPMQFLFVGAGARLPEVRRALADHPHVNFLPYQPRSRLPEMYAAADLHLVTLEDAVGGLLVPSKYAAALAAEKPVLLVGGGEMSLVEEISRQKVGWACQHDPNAIEGALREAASDPEARRRMGARAREVFAAHYSRAQNTARWIELLRGAPR